MHRFTVDLWINYGIGRYLHHYHILQHIEPASFNADICMFIFDYSNKQTGKYNNNMYIFQSAHSNKQSRKYNNSMFIFQLFFRKKQLRKYNSMFIFQLYFRNKQSRKYRKHIGGTAASPNAAQILRSRCCQLRKIPAIQMPHLMQ